MKRGILVLLFILLTSSLMTGCDSASSSVSTPEMSNREWELLLDSAKNTTVTIAHNYKDEDTIEWFEDFEKAIEASHGITVKMMYMDLDETYEDLLDDRAMEKETGRYDVILIKEDGFKYGMDNDLFYGPITDKLPNLYTNMGPGDFEVLYDEGIAIDGMSVPFIREQLCFIYEEDILYDPPLTYDEMFEIVENNKGKFTYPHPSIFEGELFITGYVASVVDYETLNDVKSKDELRPLIQPALDRLIQLKPYMYKSGYIAKSMVELDQLFFEQQVLFSMSMDYNHPLEMTKKDEYTEGSRAFVVEDGTTGTVQYATIAYNAPNKSAAMVVINELLSPDNQASIYDITDLGKLHVYNVDVAPKESFTLINKVQLKRSAIKEKDLLKYRIPEVSSELRTWIVELWSEAYEK